MTSSSLLLGSVFEAFGTDVESWQQSVCRDKVVGIGRVEPCDNVKVAQDDMVDIAGIRHSSKGERGHRCDVPFRLK